MTEIIQYPIIKSLDVQDHPNILSLVSVIEKQKFLTLDGSSDRPLLINYCANDILKSLMVNGFIQEYISLLCDYTSIIRD